MKECVLIRLVPLVATGFVALGAVATPRLAQAVSTTVVVSQAYPGGGESGAAFQSDYVVLFNNGAGVVDLSSWSLQIEVPGPVGPMWEVVPLCGAIPHGRFYLVGLASGGPTGSSLPAPDCSGTVDLPSSTGKVVLVSSTSPLSGSCPLTNPSVVDMLGYGSRVDCSEGSPAASPDPATALMRNPGNPCTDTDANDSDFVLGTPDPMNTSSPGNGCNNSSPTVSPIAPQSVDELAMLMVTPSGSDLEGDPLTWSGSNLPPGSSVAPGTGVFTWTPGGGDAGLYAGVMLIANDGLGGSASASFDITVADVTPPVIAPLADAVVAEGSSVTVTVMASDADGDPLSFSYSPTLPWITQDPATGELTVAPGYDVASPGGASFGITVEASDGTHTETAFFTIEVFDGTTAANTPQAARSWTGVSLLTGELAFAEPSDLCLGGPRPLCFGRYYASLLERVAGAPGTLGENWRGSYDWAMAETPSEVKVVDPHGRIYRFASAGGGTWTLVEPQDAPYELTDLGTEFSFAHARHRAFYIFDRSNGALSRIEDGRGTVHTLTYVGGHLSTISDGLGRTLTLTHDGSGRVTSVTDGTRTVTYGYTGPTLASVTDAESQTTTYVYDLASGIPGLLTAVVDASGGNPLQYAYDSDGQVVQVQLDSGASMTMARSLGSGQVQTSLQLPDGGTHVFVHDPYGRCTQYTDPQSGVTSWTYDAQGRLTSVMRPSTIVPWQIDYDPVMMWPSTVTLADASQWQITYVARNYTAGHFYLPSTVQAPDLGLITCIYDGPGNLTQITDQASHTWTMTYNGFGQPLTITNPTSGVITNTYDLSGRLVTTNDGAGTTQFAYNALDQLTTITHPDASTRTFTWNARGQLLMATDELSETWSYAYRDNGQLESVTDPLTATTTVGYGPRNRVSQVTDALMGVTSIAYTPSRWQVASVTDPTLRTVTYQYDLLGQLTGITDPAGHSTTLGRDADGRVTAVTDPLSHTWSYGYNNRDQLVSATDPLTNTTAYVHDPVGRLTAINRPLGLTTTYTRDLRGLVTSATTGPVTVSYAYTPLRQLDTFTDGEGHAWTRTYDAMGRLTSVEDPLFRSATFSYNNRNRLTGLTHPEGSATFAYNAASRLTQRSYSDGTVHSYTYDANGRMLTTEGVSRTYDLLGRILEENGITYAYDAAGRLETETYSAGHEIGHSFDPRGLPSQTTDWLSGVTTYTYDDAGRLTDLVHPNGTAAHIDYDDANRLTGLVETSSSDVLGSFQVTRDALGRATSVGRTTPLMWAPDASSRSYSYDAASQVVGFIYDGSGRLTDDGSRTYTWDGASRADMIQEGPVTTQHVSDGLDRVGSVLRSGEPQLDLVRAPWGGPPKIVREVATPGGATTDRAHWVTTPGGIPLYRIDLSGGTPTRRYYHFDETGSTAFVTNEVGSVVASYAYSPSGESTTLGEAQPYPGLTYRGQLGVVEEAPSGLYRLGSRFYDALTTQSLPTPGSHNLNRLELNWEGGDFHIADVIRSALDEPIGHNRGSDREGILDQLATTTEWFRTSGASGLAECPGCVTNANFSTPAEPGGARVGGLTTEVSSRPPGVIVKIMAMAADSPGIPADSHPQEVLDLVAAATGAFSTSGASGLGERPGNDIIVSMSQGQAAQANRRYLYFGKLAAILGEPGERVMMPSFGADPPPGPTRAPIDDIDAVTVTISRINAHKRGIEVPAPFVVDHTLDHMGLHPLSLSWSIGGAADRPPLLLDSQYLGPGALLPAALFHAERVTFDWIP